ncbi:MAG: helix-turn-helix transcriptional regulator [Planctomycetes bacterium]|nr:helix-turn-helix transcriptional regulator [Planctomycetota bacterium]
MAAACGFSQPQLSRWLAGHRRLRSDHLATLLGILGMSIVPEHDELRTLYLGQGLSVIHPSNAGRRF